ncbi:MAG TPA: hypothetical protein VFK72_04385, partial [Nevskia sp.]|nr:hypothetical protein [Nevskia sp.]
DPALGGTEDPTRLVIESAPVFRVLKSSQDMTGDPNVLRQGDTLHYTITIKNVGNDDATGAIMRDAIPANTTYVAGSTRLNGAVVPDNAGVSALVNGMLIDAPQDPTPGVMRADASDTQANVATITFDVVATPTVVDGTAICNQAFVSSLAHHVIDSRSDDPRTAVLNDPTCSVVGNLPLLYAEKKAALQTDLGTPGAVDPGDVVRYTITVYNNGNVPATGVVLTDAVPANTTYVANSVTLNGLPVGQPDGGVSPLIAGVNISSSDLTPPLPAAGQGTLSVGKSAVIQFDVRVNDGVPGGTLISNQGFVNTQQLPVLPTDGDGDPSNGPQPTIVVVGNGQQLSITKQVEVVGGGPALPGGQLEYVVRATNISTVPAISTVITDDLDSATPGYLRFVDQSATLNDSPSGITISGSVLTADYSGTYGPLPPGQTAVLRFRATLSPTLAMGTRVTNTAVVKWNNPLQTASASVSIDVGGITGVGLLSGTAWHDANFNKTLDTNERRLEGWSVELYRNGRLVHSVLTDATGVYRISGVAPNDGNEDKYELRFTRPGAGPNTAKLGKADSVFTNDLQRISDIVVQPGSNLQNLNLPIAPNGVIYNSMSRTPIAGAAVRMLDARSRTELPGSCFSDPAQQNQVTLSDGWYRFDIGFSDPACPSGSSYLLEVTTPSSGYVAGSSQIIPPKSDASTTAFSVPACPGSADDAIPATTQFCEVQPSELPPAASVLPRSAGTTYYANLRLDGSQPPGSSQIFNNHIPLDPILVGSIAISKTTPLLNVNRGQLVPYVITVNNISGQMLTASVVDRLPAGFAYIEGSALVDGVPTAPSVTGRELSWTGLVLAGTQVRTLKLLLAVGAGVTEGEYVNRAQAVNSVTGSPMSGEATATVRVVADPT